jgi:hypothetical protein
MYVIDTWLCHLNNKTQDSYKIFLLLENYK